MALVGGTPGNIEFGPCQVTVGGTDLGFIDGGSVFTYTIEYRDFTVDQTTTKIDTRIVSEMAVLSVPMAETTLDKLALVFPTGTYVLDSGAAKKKLGVGGNQISVADDAVEVILTPVIDGAATIGTSATALNEKITIFKAIPKINFEKTYNRTDPKIVTIDFEAYRDSTQTTGNQLFLLGDSSATA